MIDIQAIKSRFETLAPHLNERARRLLAASEAQTAGRDSIAALAEVTGIARSTIGRGLAELRTHEGASSRRIRHAGGGSKPKVETAPGLLGARGDRTGQGGAYGVYDIAANAGWINLGITSDTAAFAVQSIWRCHASEELV